MITDTKFRSYKEDCSYISSGLWASEMIVPDVEFEWVTLIFPVG